MDQTKLHFQKSKRCPPVGGCLEVANDGDVIYIRDSKNPEQMITVSRADWETFLSGAKDGDFD